jgi:hypothetical protein
MDEREDYADHDLPPSILDGEWRDAARNLFVAGVLVGLALLLAGLIVVKVTVIPHTPLPEVPAPDPCLELGTPAPN